MIKIVRAPTAAAASALLVHPNLVRAGVAWIVRMVRPIGREPPEIHIPSQLGREGYVFALLQIRPGPLSAGDRRAPVGRIPASVVGHINRVTLVHAVPGAIGVGG